MRRPDLIAAAVLVSALCGCSAFDVPAPPCGWSDAEAQASLSRADCVRLARESATTAAAWRSRLDAAAVALRTARTPPSPGFAVEWEDLGVDPATPAAQVQTTWSLAVALGGIFTMPWRIAAARHEEAATIADRRADLTRLAAEVAIAYDELVAARRRLGLQADRRAIVERERDAVGRFVSSGTAPRVALDRVEAELAEAEQDHFTAEREASRLEHAFAFALGFDRPVPLELAEPLTPPADASDADLEALLVEAAADRAEIAAASERMRARVEDRDLEVWRLSLLPTVRGGVREQGGVRSKTAGLELGLPLFDLGQNGVEAANADLLSAAAELSRVTREVSAQVNDALDRAVTSRERLERFARPQVERRARLREETERLFSAGQVDLDALVLALRDEAHARDALLDAELEAAAAHERLDAAIGR